VGWEEVTNIDNKDTSLSFVMICVRLRPLSSALCLFLQKTDRYLHDLESCHQVILRCIIVLVRPTDRNNSASIV
jgi:hypothetical protein